MIIYKKPYFILETKDLTYAFKVIKTGHLEHLYFGNKIGHNDLDNLHTKITAKARGVVDYSEEKDKDIPLDLMPLEYSSFGKGDFKLTPIEIKMPDHTFVSDFIYESHQIKDGIYPIKDLPQPYDEDHQSKSLIITLKDAKFNIYLDLIYHTFQDSNCITR